MSKYAEQQTQYKDADCLIESLKAVGISDVQVHATARHLYGFQGDKRPETAEIIIPRHAVGSLSNDIGFKRQANGTFAAIVSDYDSTKYNAEWMKTLRNTYTEKFYLKQAAKAGLRVAGRTVVNGRVQLQFIAR